MDEIRFLLLNGISHPFSSPFFSKKNSRSKNNRIAGLQSVIVLKRRGLGLKNGFLYLSFAGSLKNN